MTRGLEPSRPAWPQEMQEIPDLNALGVFDEY